MWNICLKTIEKIRRVAEKSHFERFEIDIIWARKISTTKKFFEVLPKTLETICRQNITDQKFFKPAVFTAICSRNHIILKASQKFETFIKMDLSFSHITEKIMKNRKHKIYWNQNLNSTFGLCRPKSCYPALLFDPPLRSNPPFYFENLPFQSPL